MFNTSLKILAATGLLALAACGPDNNAPAYLAVDVVSNRPYLLSGGDALIEVTASTADSGDIELLLNGTPVESDLAKTGGEANRYIYRARIDGMSNGTNTLRARMGSASAELPLVNYSVNGPVFSGPHLEPYFCLSQLAPEDGEKRRFAIGNGDYLQDSPTDADCSLPTRIDYVYKSSNADEEFLPLDDPSSVPADVVNVNTIEGKEVPFVVRLETGTINRAIYQIAILHDPSGPVPSPLGDPGSWNERLIYTFGGGCEAGYVQANDIGDVLEDYMLRRGYAVASSSLNVNSKGGCNDVLSAETAMMVKEHFIETYGVPRLSLIHISEPTRHICLSRMPSSA